MPSSTNSAYSVALFNEVEPFACPQCKFLLLPKFYEKHCKDAHNINPKKTCVWCLKKSWKHGQKKDNILHLKDCMKKFLHPSLANGERKLLISEHLYLQKHIYGEFSKLPTDGEYDELWPLEITVEPPITFRDENLNLAAALILMFLQLLETREWHHVLVKTVVFDKFLNALDEGITRTVPFSCWCNGGKYQEDKHRQHRHFIVVSPKGHFEKHFWPKVQMSEPRPYKLPCKRSKKIDSPMHLINTLGYISHRKSQCKFSFEEDESTPISNHHFYFYRTLPKDFELPLALLFEGGLERFMYEKQFQQVSIPRVVETPMEFVADKYRQRIKYFYKYERGWVVPVSKCFMPTKKITPHYLHLLNGEKLYFERDPRNESMDDELWLEKQAEGGNLFYDNVGEELWTPRPRDQRILNYHMPVVDENRNLKVENENLEENLNAWKRKYEDCYEENKRLKLNNISTNIL